MIRLIRAAGFAAAVSVAAFGAFYAGPSRAWEMDGLSASGTYIDHASAGLDTADLALNAPGAPVAETAASTSVTDPVPSRRSAAGAPFAGRTGR